MITNHKEGKEKPPRLFPETGYPLGYPEPALQQKTEERERETIAKSHSNRKTNSKLIIHVHISTNAENLVKIGPVYSQIIGWICQFLLYHHKVTISTVISGITEQKLIKFLKNVAGSTAFNLLKSASQSSNSFNNASVA